MSVPVSPLVIPAFVKPIRAIKRPMPTAPALRSVRGIERIIASRIPKIESTIKSTPSSKTAVSANAGVHPIPRTTVYVKNAFNPKPGAKATGRFAQNAITSVPIAAETAVAVNTLPQLRLAADKIPGFTARMYDIARNVVIPPIISRFTVVPRSFNLKNFSISDKNLHVFLLTKR